MIGGGGLLPVYWDNVTGTGESVSVCVWGGGGGVMGGSMQSMVSTLFQCVSMVYIYR